MPCILHYLIQKGWEITNHILMDKKGRPGRPDSNWESVFMKISLHPTRKENQKRQIKNLWEKSISEIHSSLYWLQKCTYNQCFQLSFWGLIKHLTSLKMNMKCGILKNVFFFLQIRSFTVGNTARHTRLVYDFYRSLISTEWVN